MSKFLHTRIRVSDLERSVHFYKEHLGFEEIRRSPSPAGNQLVFLELPGNKTKLEICYSDDFGEVDFPEDIFHMAFSVDDMDAVWERMEEAGLPLWPDDGPITTSSGSRMCFVDDPDGYEIELLESGGARDDD